MVVFQKIGFCDVGGAQGRLDITVPKFSSSYNGCSIEVAGMKSVGHKTVSS